MWFVYILLFVITTCSFGSSPLIDLRREAVKAFTLHLKAYQVQPDCGMSEGTEYNHSTSYHRDCANLHIICSDITVLW